MQWDLDQLDALATAVSEGSFDAAAEVLSVTPSAISQRIKALENHVGRVLVIRSRPIRPTSSGETLLRAARQIAAVTADAARELGDGDGTEDGEVATVALAVNADSLATWLLPGLTAITPPVALDLRRADETRTAELLRDGSVLAAVSANPDPVPGCIVRPLGTMRYRPRASPAFVERWFPDGVSVAALERAPVVVFDRTDTLQDSYLNRRSRRTLNPPRHHVPGSSAFLSAVCLGLGWGMVPDLQADQDPGALVELDPRGAVDVALYWQQWRLRSATLERVADAVMAAADSSLAPPTPRRPRSSPARRDLPRST